MTPRRPTLALLVVLALLAAGCGGGDGETAPPDATASPEPTVSPAEATPTPAEPTPPPEPTPSPPTPSRTASPTPVPGEDLVVDVLTAGTDGISVLGADGSARRLVTGAATVAYDDLGGGIIFQGPLWDYGDSVDTTTIWHLSPPESVVALVKPPEADVLLSLQDVQFIDQEPHVVYTTRPIFRDPINTISELHIRSIITGADRFVTRAGGWESASEPVSVGGDLFAMNRSAEAETWIEFRDLDGNIVEVATNSLPDRCFDRSDCPELVDLSPSGDRFAYAQLQMTDGIAFPVELIVVDIASGAELARVPIRDDGDPRVTRIDLDERQAVLSRFEAPPLVIDLTADEPEAVSLDEQAVTATNIRVPLDLPVPVAMPTGDLSSGAFNFLVHGPSGLSAWSEAGVADEWLTDEAIATAAVGADGVYYQAYPPVPGCAPIRYLPEPGGQSSVIIDDVGGACVRLHAVGTIGGASHIVYSYPVEPELRQTALRNTRTGDDVDLAPYGTFDGDLLSASISEQLISLTLQGSSDQGAALLFDVDGNPIDGPFPPSADPIGVGDCWVGALSPAGSSFAYAETGSCSDAPYELVVILVGSGQELLRVELPADVDWPGATSVAFDPTGRYVLVTTRDTPPWLLGLDASLTSLEDAPAETYALRRTADPTDCLTYLFSNGATYCAVEGGLSFLPERGPEPRP